MVATINNLIIDNDKLFKLINKKNDEEKKTTELKDIEVIKEVEKNEIKKTEVKEKMNDNTSYVNKLLNKVDVKMFNKKEMKPRTVIEDSIKNATKIHLEEKLAISS